MSCGSLELKRSYQRNLGLSAVLSWSGFILLALCLSYISSLNRPSERVIRTMTIAELTTPPIMVIEDEPIGSPVVEGRPVPAPKTQDNMKVQIGKRPYRGEVYGVVPDLNLLNVAGSNNNTSIEVKSLATRKMKLIETDRLPECFHVILPKYPDSARINEIEADVFVLVLVDQKGRVREVIAKPSRPGWGFAEVTVGAVEEWEFKPAMSNNEEVAVRIAYRLRFRLKRS